MDVQQHPRPSQDQAVQLLRLSRGSSLEEGYSPISSVTFRVFKYQTVGHTSSVRKKMLASTRGMLFP